MSSASMVAVSFNKLKHDKRPAHHANDSKSSFINPWDSFDKTRNESAPVAIYNMRRDWVNNPLPPPEERPQIVRPNWGIDASNGGKNQAYAQDIKATWLGHACFLVEFPSPDPEKRGYRVLYDPVFSHRCSPSQLVGPARYTPPPIPMKEIPEVDAVVISHNHYDHTDTATLKHLYSAQPAGSIHFIVPLGVRSYMKSIGIRSEQISEFDWWDSATLKTPLGGNAQLKITCTPCQHFSGRGIFDRNGTLWASWAVEFEDTKAETKMPSCKVWFGGDTGYRSVARGFPRDQEHTLPHCPVFKEIGDKFGGFDLAMIPIGAFEPRWFMSSVHCNPEDSVAMHLDVKSRKSVGIHWACFPLTCEKIWEPKERLEATVARTDGMKKEDFIALNRIGETLRVTPKTGEV